MGGAGIRGRRSLRALLVLLFAAASVGGFLYSSTLETSLIHDAARHARLAAQVKLAGVLGERDLAEAAGGDRYDELRAAIDRVMPPEFETVTLWSPSGKILYHDDEAMVGTRPTYPREFLGDVANGSTEVKVEADLLKTFVPVWVEPGGTIAVAQLDRTVAPVVSPAKLLRIGSGVLGVVALVLLVRAVLLAVRSKGNRPASPGTPVAESGFRIGPRPMARPVPPSTPMTPVVVTSSGPKPAAADRDAGVEVVRPLLSTIKPAPESYQDPAMGSVPPGRHATRPREAAADGALDRLQRERDDAIALAEKAERTVDDVRTQHRAALEKIDALEARLIAAAEGPVHSQEDIQALRDQMRETAERLYRAEEENRALKVRVSELENPLAAPAGLTSRLNEIAHDRLTTGG